MLDLSNPLLYLSVSHHERSLHVDAAIFPLRRFGISNAIGCSLGFAKGHFVSKALFNTTGQGGLGIGGEDELEKGDGAAAPATNSSSKAMSNDLMKGDDLEKLDDLK